MKTNVVKQVAKLANLDLSEEQLTTIGAKFELILQYFEEIKSLDLSKVSGTSRASDQVNVFREDEVQPSFSQEQALQNVKATHNGFVVVKNVFEERDE